MTSLERQSDEVEALLAIFEGDEEISIEVTGLESLRERLAAKEEEEEVKDVPPGLDISVVATKNKHQGQSQDVILVINFHNQNGIPKVRMRLPGEYPNTSPHIELGSKFLIDTCQDEVREIVDQACIEGEECLFQIIQALKEAAMSFGQQQEQEQAAALNEDEDEDLEEGFDLNLPSVSGNGKEISTCLGRRLCYSHHIIAPSKRKAIVQWALQLQLGGCSKIGWPGLIVIEGDEKHCQIYVEALQRLRWKKVIDFA